MSLILRRNQVIAVTWHGSDKDRNAVTAQRVNRIGVRPQRRVPPSEEETIQPFENEPTIASCQ